MATKDSQTRSDAVKARAEASFKKEERAAEGAKAMQEYQASGREVREQMARLRALRLARDAEDKGKAPAGEKAKSVKIAAKPGAKSSPKARKTTAAAE